jgi:hypothetical protein
LKAFRDPADSRTICSTVGDRPVISPVREGPADIYTEGFDTPRPVTAAARG